MWARLDEWQVQMRILDLFCGAGGAARGYQLAGFHLTGVDIKLQPNYVGEEFIQADAMEFLTALLGGDVIGAHGCVLADFDGIHASVPCQAYSTIAKQQRSRRPDTYEYPELVAEARELLVRTDLPYVIENVVGAPLVNPVMLCGSSFGLDLRRHRLFEANFPIMVPPCAHHWQTPRFRSLDQRPTRPKLLSTIPVYGTGHHLATVVGVHGHTNYPGEHELRERAMGIDWMTTAELSQAIPPAYTQHVGHYLMAACENLRPL